jgi:hypothetical protein
MPKESPNQPYVDPKPTLNKPQTTPKTNPKKAKQTLNQSEINTKTNPKWTLVAKYHPT